MSEVTELCAKFEALEQSIESASVVMDYIFDAGQAGKVDELNEVMGALDVAAGGFVVTCFLRGSFMFSSHLSNWKVLRDRYIEYCEANKIDYVEHMYGLMPKDDYDYGESGTSKAFKRLVGINESLI